MDLNFQVITLKVRGLRDYKKRRNIFHWLKANISPNSIVFLQETHSDKSTGGHNGEGTLDFLMVLKMLGAP